MYQFQVFHPKCNAQSSLSLQMDSSPPLSAIFTINSHRMSQDALQLITVGRKYGISVMHYIICLNYGWWNKVCRCGKDFWSSLSTNCHVTKKLPIKHFRLKVKVKIATKLRKARFEKVILSRFLMLTTFFIVIPPKRYW